MTSISFIAKLTKSILKFTKPDYMDSKEKIDEFLNKKIKEESKPVKGPFKSFLFKGMQVFHYGNAESNRIIIFIHGGAYVNDINMQHHLYCSYMAKKLNAYVLSPVYPLAPAHNAMETLELVTGLYENVFQRESEIILMGDSAGGGFVLSMCQYLKTINLSQPDNIIVFSPWVDISLNNPPYNNQDDPILGEIGLREMGKAWCGQLNPQDYKVSPLYGDNTGLARTLIFTGDNEIFYKDILKYHENLKGDGVDTRLIIGEGLFHIYPLFPIPEAKKAFNEIKKELSD